MDGILLKYSSNWECVGDWYIQAAGFVVDEHVDHFAWVAEAGWLDIMDWGFDFRYSFIDWVKKGHNRCGINDPRGFHFRNSQFSLQYNFNVMCMPSNIFGAFLWNHDARKVCENRKNPHRRHQNIGWYVGFEWGQVLHEGDWAIKGQYQVVEAFAIPEGDVSGIGRGNILQNSITANNCGNTNYKGWRVEALYALTDNLTINPRFDWSTEKDANLGGKHRYNQLLMEVIYAF